MFLDDHKLCMYDKISKEIILKAIKSNTPKYAYKCNYRKIVKQLNSKEDRKIRWTD